MVPGESEAASINLYSGTPGIILFLLELHHATGKQEYLQEAMDGIFLLQGAYTEGGSWPEAAGTTREDPAIRNQGLYTGQAGAAFTLLEVHRVTGQDLPMWGAGSLIDEIKGEAQPAGSEEGVAWYQEDLETASYDIISGSAGIGLTLLYAHALMDDPFSLDVADQAGVYLAGRGRPAEGGLKWPISEANPRLMPNFSHGTAGVAYFLVKLYQATQIELFLDTAIQGARYLQAASLCREGGCRIHHHEPDGEDLFYLGWCHGPTGTARLFFELSRTTGDPAWMEWVLQGTKALRDAGIPDFRPEGYWNNVSQCCGDAGVGDYFLSLAGAAASGEPGTAALAEGTTPEESADFARRLGSYMVGEALEDESGVHWLQAENRTQPEFLQAQTGWMQGAAGVGAFFLHLDGLAKGRKALVNLPDSPWAGLI